MFYEYPDTSGLILYYETRRFCNKNPENSEKQVPAFAKATAGKNWLIGFRLQRLGSNPLIPAYGG
jgi:hypothetical protein